MLAHSLTESISVCSVLPCQQPSVSLSDLKISIHPDGNADSDQPAPSIAELTSSLRPAPDSPEEQPVMETQQEAIMRQLRESLPNMKIQQSEREKEFQQILIEQMEREAKMTERAKRIKRPASNVNLFLEQIEEFDGSDEDKPIYVSIWRKIYDITDGMKYYGAKGKYNYLAGKEVGRAMATGCFESTGLTYDMRSLSEEQKGVVRAWQEFYGRKYKHVGYLKGKKVDESAPTPNDNCEEAERYGGRPQV